MLVLRLQDFEVSTFGRALRRLNQAQAACRAAARHGWLLSSQSHDFEPAILEPFLGL